MPPLIADASISLAWDLPDEASPYADAVLMALEDRPLRVPSLWAREVANGLVSARKRRRTTNAQEQGFMALLSRLTIKVENAPPLIVIQTGTDAALRFVLTAYDAAYVDLALREGLPLATLDEAMRRAAPKAGVTLFKPQPEGFSQAWLKADGGSGAIWLRDHFR